MDVDLANERVQAVPLPSEEVLRAWIGGTGLSLYLLAGEITAGMKTTAPEAPVIVMTGPLTWTLVASSSNGTMINLRYKPDFVVGLSLAHGRGFNGEPRTATTGANGADNDPDVMNVTVP